MPKYSHVQPPTTQTPTNSRTNVPGETPSATTNNCSFPQFQFPRITPINATMNQMNPHMTNNSVPTINNIPKFPIPSLPNLSTLAHNQPSQTQMSFLHNPPNPTHGHQTQILVPIGNMNGSLNSLNNLNFNFTATANNYCQPQFQTIPNNYPSFQTVHNQHFQPLPPSTVIVQTNGNDAQSNVHQITNSLNNGGHKNMFTFVPKHPPPQQQSVVFQSPTRVIQPKTECKTVIKNVIPRQIKNEITNDIQSTNPNTNDGANGKLRADSHKQNKMGTAQSTKVATKGSVSVNGNQRQKTNLNIPKFIRNYNQKVRHKRLYVVRPKTDFDDQYVHIKRVLCCDILCEEKKDSNDLNNVTYFKCPKCEKKYKYLCNLRSHSKVHTNEAHVCEYCQKRFGRRANYQEHRRVHTGESPYICQVCKKSFKQKHGLKDHMKLRCTAK